MFSMSRNILATSEFTSGGRHIVFQDGHSMFYITLYLTSYCTLKTLYLGTFLLCGNCHHMGVISEFKMAATLLDMPFSMIYSCRLPCQLSNKVAIYPFRSDGSHIQFHDGGCIAGPFRCH